MILSLNLRLTRLISSLKLICRIRQAVINHHHIVILGFLPTFGPSLLHMYGTSYVGTMGPTGEDGPFHRGALLVSLKTIVPYYQGVQGARNCSVEPVAPIIPVSKLY